MNRRNFIKSMLCVGAASAVPIFTYVPENKMRDVKFEIKQIPEKSYHLLYRISGRIGKTEYSYNSLFYEDTPKNRRYFLQTANLAMKRAEEAHATGKEWGTSHYRTRA